MKLIKKKVALILIVVLVFSLSGCRNKDEFSHERLKNLAKELNIQDYKDKTEMYKEFSYFNKKVQGYKKATGDEAQEWYDLLINRMKMFPENNIDEFTVLSVGTTGMNIVYLVSFEDSKKAKDFFDEYTKKLSNNGTEGTYTYAYKVGEYRNGDTNIRSAYLQKDKVLFINCRITDTSTVKEICNRLNIVVPIVE